MPQKIAFNGDFGGFSLSIRGTALYHQLSGSTKDTCMGREIPRDDPYLIQVLETLGEEAWGDCAYIKIVEIPDDILWTIEEYDGLEHIAEVHRTWR